MGGGLAAFNDVSLTKDDWDKLGKNVFQSGEVTVKTIVPIAEGSLQAKRKTKEEKVVDSASSKTAPVIDLEAVENVRKKQPLNLARTEKLRVMFKDLDSVTIAKIWT